MRNQPGDVGQQALETLQRVEQLRAKTRGDLRDFWFPLVLFGGLTLASAAMALTGLPDGVGTAIFWAVAGPAGGVAVAVYYHRRELALGATRAPLPYVATSIGLMALAFGLPAVTRGDLREVVSVFAVAAAYAVFAWLERSPTLAGLAVFLAVVPPAVLALDVAAAGPVTAVITGAVILGTGIRARRAE